MEKSSKIYIAGHRGLVGSAIWRSLQSKGYSNLIGKSHAELDLLNPNAVKDFFDKEQPEFVILAAAKVGGIIANNTYRADFIYENLQIQQNVLGESFRHNVKKVLFLGSTCIYPKNAPQPMPESALLTGELEETNEPYAIAKIAGLKMCESFNLQYGTNYIAVMPTNLYGPNDNFHLENSHVLPGIIRKIYLAKCLMENNSAATEKDLAKRPVKGSLGEHGIFADRVELWGTGEPLREFLWSEDMADACVYCLENINYADVKSHINIGTGKEISIANLAMLVAKTLGYNGNIIFDNSKPNGTMRKLCDVSKIQAMGWRHKIEIEEGVKKLYEWYLRG
ncbi:MAG: GDP-L-fucose synthase [Fibromonadaceae bacterium]|jgi:GDP-L-fucose synthase|nr:GDP-L-fucose synthase [Fibromonadaceae bacterium]